jgi:DNA repair protein RecO (recombination protein O)
MALEKATAIVIRLVDFSESSSVVTLFTREYGKIGALAKGAHRHKGPFDSALDLLTRCRIVFLRKSSGGLDLLTEAKLEHRFRPPAHDLGPLFAGYYLAELLLGLTEDYDPHPQLFDVAASTLTVLSGSGDVASTVLCFELNTLQLLGHMPNLDHCVECGRSIAPERRVAFGQSSGGVLCETCRPGKRHVASISGESLQVLRGYAARKIEDLQQENLQGNISGEVRGVINHTISHLLGRKPKMQEHLRFLADDLE